MMAALYGVDVRTINEHVKKIFSDGELAEAATIRKFRIVQTEGSRRVSRETNHYNLQADGARALTAPTSLPPTRGYLSGHDSS
jgi:hypothetical protein